MKLNILITHSDTRFLSKLYTDSKIASMGGSSTKIHFDSGVDLYCPDNILVDPGETKFINLGVACAATKYNHGIYQPAAFYLYPRSSLSKTPLRLANSVGIIDSGYRGNIIAAVDNISDEGFLVKKGTRLFQICAPDLSMIDFDLVDKLDKTTRGEGGFGSTGS